MKQVKISAFQEWLNSDSEDNGLQEALRALSELVNPQSIIEAKGEPSMDLGSWGGWR